MFVGVIERIVEWSSRDGFVGAVLGRIFAGFINLMLPMMLTHFVQIVWGIDPLTYLDSPLANKKQLPQ